MLTDGASDDVGTPRTDGPGSSPPERSDAAVPAGAGRNDYVQVVRLAALFVVALAAVYLLLLFLWPFVSAIVTSAVLAVLAYPLYRRFDAPGRKSVVALLATAILFLVILLPLGALSVVVAVQLPEWSGWLSSVAAAAVEPQGSLQRFVADLALRVGIDPADLAAAAPQQIQQVAGLVAGRTFRILSGLGGWVLQAGVALFTLYYLLRDADGFVASFKWALPLTAEEADELLRRSREVIFATIYGTVVIALVQGVLGGLIFWILDVPAPAFWGLMMGVLGLLPVIGPPIVWLPAGIALLFTGEIAKGIILLLLGAVLISGIDNVIRPLIVGGRAQLHPLVVFFSVLGGIAVFGALGILVGPVVFAAALTFVEMARMAMLPEGDRRRMRGMLLRAGRPPKAVDTRRWSRTTDVDEEAGGES